MQVLSNYAMQQTVRAARPLLSRLRPASPHKVARKGRATRPAADRGRWAGIKGLKYDTLSSKKYGQRL